MAAYLVCVYHFLPYSARNQYLGGHPEWAYLHLAISLAAGFLLTLGIRTSRYWVGHSMLATAFVAHAVLVAFDTAIDPTDHNLLPFEFVMIAIYVSPAYLGAFLSRLIWRPAPPELPRA